MDIFENYKNINKILDEADLESSRQNEALEVEIDFNHSSSNRQRLNDELMQKVNLVSPFKKIKEESNQIKDLKGDFITFAK